MALLSYHPFKAIFTIATIFTVPPYLILLAFAYQFKRLRPNSEWSFRTAIAAKALQIFYKYATTVTLKPVVHTKAPKGLGNRYVMVQPGPDSIYTSVLRSDEKINPTPMPAIWFSREYDKSSDEGKTVVIHFQGGAFVHAGDPLDMGPFASSIYERHFGALTFYAQYRLSRDDNTRFPAALQDVVTFYRHVLDLGISPRNIIVCGDSAGGNLVIALARYISETNTLPPPRGILAWSPWVDLSTNTLNSYRTNPLRHSDFVAAPLGFWGRDWYIPKQSRPLSKEVDAYINLVEYPFHSTTPLFLQVGTAELFIEDVKRFAKELREVHGNTVEYLETKNAPHDIILAGKILGLEKDVHDAVQKAKEFFEKSSVTNG